MWSLSVKMTKDICKMARCLPGNISTFVGWGRLSGGFSPPWHHVIWTYTYYKNFNMIHLVVCRNVTMPTFYSGAWAGGKVKLQSVQLNKILTFINHSTCCISSNCHSNRHKYNPVTVCSFLRLLLLQWGCQNRDQIRCIMSSGCMN